MTSHSVENLISSSELSLPRRPFSTISIIDELDKTFREYHAAIDRLDDTHRGYSELVDVVRSLVPVAKILAASIIQAFKASLKEDQNEAYQQLRKGLSALSDQLDRLNSIQVAAADFGTLYRLRLQKNPEEILDQRSDLFHVPFSCAAQNPSGRYDLPGTPVLYLAGSVYLAREELGRPEVDLSSIWCSAYRATQPLRVLNLGWRPHTLAEIAPALPFATGNKAIQLRNLLAAYLTVWPLIAACAIQHNPNDYSKAAYRIPRLLMQWIRQEGLVDGIRYFTTRVPHYGLGICAGADFAFPAYSHTKDDYCDQLRKKFSLTTPTLLSDALHTPIDSAAHLTRDALIVWQGEPTIYAHTPFAQIEAVLHTKEFATIS